MCDEQALANAVSQFEIDPGADAAPRELVDAMARACPGYPGVLFDYLEDYVRRDDEIHWPGLPLPYQYARYMACDDPGGWAAASDLAAEERAPAVYEACGFERLGLLDAGEPFMFDDIIAMVSQDWMLDHRVDASLARRFHRGLMIATAPEPLSRRRCWMHPDSFACEALMRAHGGGLPHSNILASDEGPMVLLSSSWLAFEAPGGIVELSAITELPPPKLEVDDPVTHLRVMADAEIAWSRVIETLHVASQRGFTTASLVVANDNFIEDIPLSMPTVWFASDAPAQLPAVYRVERDGVHLPDGSVIGHAELDRLEPPVRAQLANTPKRSSPELPFIHPLVVRAGADIELQTVVRVLDAIRGRACRVLDREDEDCLVLAPLVDLDPPVPRRPGDWSKLELRLDELPPHVWREDDLPMTAEQLAAQIERSLEPLRACLLASESARLYVPERLVLFFGRTVSGRVGVNVAKDGPGWLPTACLADALGMVEIRFDRSSFADAEIFIDVPNGAPN